MLRVLAHRGPDDSGLFEDAGVTLGHTRLSIIDLSAAGHQPMTSRDQSAVIVFNGEIYNFSDLRSELEAQGVVFRSRSDTEVALEAWCTWREKAWARLNGMFAIAIWDRRARRLHLARDRFGIKPLYVVRNAAQIAFASEIKALRSGGVDLGDGIDPQGLVEYLQFGNTLGETTLYGKVRRLLPARVLSVDGSGERLTRYWRPPASQPRAKDEAAGDVRERLIAAVGRQLVSDVPVGVFLSGGVDSSSIVAAAVQAGQRRLQTYTVQFDFDTEGADVRAARAVARHFGTAHHELAVSGYDVRALLNKLLDAHDAPFGDAANIPLYLLARALQGDPKVILQGDGGDELFGGYRRYTWLSWLSWLAPGARLSRWLAPAIPHPELRARVLRVCAALGARDPAVRMGLLLSEDKPDSPTFAALAPQIQAELSGLDPLRRYREVAAEYSGTDPVQLMSLTDCAILLPDLFLEKVDRATMAHSIEIRVPYLDNELADFVLGLPAHVKLPHGRTKALLRSAVAGMTPRMVLERPKTGFGVPYGEWLRGPLYGQLQERLLGNPGLFNVGFCERMLAEHQGRVREHGFVLWKLLNLALWSEGSGRNRLGTRRE